VQCHVLAVEPAVIISVLPIAFILPFHFSVTSLLIWHSGSLPLPTKNPETKELQKSLSTLSRSSPLPWVFIALMNLLDVIEIF
jgi:hypothetical protein